MFFWHRRKKTPLACAISARPPSEFKCRAILNLMLLRRPSRPSWPNYTVHFELRMRVQILVCGSTVEGEEPMLLRAFANMLSSHPRAVMILAPRHPQRFKAVAQLLQGAGIRFWQRSAWKGETLSGGVLLLDTIGELAALYSLGDIAFVGGSLVPRGGHNIIEAARHGAAIVVGPHTENFRDIVRLFENRQALRVVRPEELSKVLLELISNQNARVALGRSAVETLQSQRGATQRTADALKELLQLQPTSTRTNPAAFPKARTT